MRAEKEKLENENRELSAKLEETTAKGEEDRKALTSANEKLKAELDSTNSENEQLKKENADLTEELEDASKKAEGDAETLKEENSKLSAEIEVLKSENEKLGALVEENNQNADKKKKQKSKKGSSESESDDGSSSDESDTASDEDNTSDSDDDDDDDSEGKKKKKNKKGNAKVSVSVEGAKSTEIEELEEEIQELTKEKNRLKQENELICDLVINSRDMIINTSTGVPISTVMLKDRFISGGIIDNLDNTEAFEPIENALKAVSSILVIQPPTSSTTTGFDAHLYWIQALYMLYQDLSGTSEAIFDRYVHESTAVLDRIKNIFWEHFYKKTLDLIYDEIERMGADRVLRECKGSGEDSMPPELRKAIALAVGLNAGINRFTRGELRDRISKNVFDFLDATFVNLFFGAAGKGFCNCDVGLRIKVIISNFSAKMTGAKKPALFRRLREVSNFLMLDKKLIGVDDELIKLSAPDLNLNQIYCLLMNFSPAVDASVVQLIKMRVKTSDPTTLDARNY